MARRSILLPTLLLTLLCLGIRAAGLLNLPIFGDEAIYIRWAQLIRGEGIAGPHPWVSLIDPKPPLHFWLIAAVFNWFSDPLHSAPMLSVLTGVAAIPLIVGAGIELGRLPAQRSTISGQTWGLIGALLILFCPFLAFYQRLAMSDSLFVTESLAAAWLSLRWARLATTAGPPRRAWTSAIGLGFALGAGLMTRHGMSYTFCAMPCVAWAVHAIAGRGQARFRFQAAIQFLAVAMIAGLCWLPYLTANLEQRALARTQRTDPTATQPAGSDLRTELHDRIFFPGPVAGGGLPSLSAIGRNIHVTFIPGWVPPGRPATGWFFFYLTPLVYILALVGMIWLAVRRRPAFVILTAWALLILLPVILLGHTVMSRYVLAAAPPLLLAAALLLGELTAQLLAGNFPAKTGWIAALVLWIVTLVPAIRETALQISNPRAQLLTEWWEHPAGRVRSDRYQYLTGWTAGYATRDVIRFFQLAAQQGPIVVVTANTWGNAADTLWIYLSRSPNVKLYYSDGPLLPGQTDGTWLLSRDKHLYTPPIEVSLPHDLPVFFVWNETEPGDAQKGLAKIRTNLLPPETFYGLEGDRGNGGGGAGEAVLVFPLRSRSAVPQ